MSSLAFAMCDACHKAWPAVRVEERDHVHVWDRCQKNKHIPKLSSSENNAIPGPLPDFLAKQTMAEDT